MINNQSLDRLFKALSDPTRRDILAKLLANESNIGLLAKEYEISLPAISKHVKVLEDAGLVEIKKRGKERIATFNPDGLRDAEIWLSTITEDLDTFDTLEANIQVLNIKT